MRYTDKCEVITVTYDAQYGTSTKSDPVETRCRIEDEDKYSYNSSGNIVVNEALVIMPGKVSVNKGDIVILTEIRGQTVTNQKERLVNKVLHIGRRTPHHSEVYV